MPEAVWNLFVSKFCLLIIIIITDDVRTGPHGFSVWLTPKHHYFWPVQHTESVHMSELSFRDEETEASSRRVTCARSQGQKWEGSRSSLPAHCLPEAAP